MDSFLFSFFFLLHKTTYFLFISNFNERFLFLNQLIFTYFIQCSVKQLCHQVIMGHNDFMFNI